MPDLLAYRRRAAAPTKFERRYNVGRHAPETFSINSTSRSSDRTNNARANPGRTYKVVSSLEGLIMTPFSHDRVTFPRFSKE
jgi:hypothetical protein